MGQSERGSDRGQIGVREGVSEGSERGSERESEWGQRGNQMEAGVKMSAIFRLDMKQWRTEVSNTGKPEDKL